MDGKADGLSSMSFRYEGVATTLTFTVVAEKEMYLHGINVSNDPEKQRHLLLSEMARLMYGISEQHS